MSIIKLSKTVVTANIYAHLNYRSKISSAQAMVKGMPLPSSNSFESRWGDVADSDDDDMGSNEGENGQIVLP